MATLQIRLNDELKSRADNLFESLGLDTSTAVRMFFAAALENDGIPFEVRHKAMSRDMRQAIYDSRNRVDLYGPYNTAEAAVNSMLED
ncbi:MAG: type II toxin-antitoxin system RelB/DinJ family antitoxin [Clostridia bacterium]|nr:type II toxin-antitoxin system RelB/DinJ family antitoxin [Clostridia bacterium]